jgi:uncharacterized protein
MWALAFHLARDRALNPQTVRIELEQGVVSGLFLKPEQASACFAFAHGAGAGVASPFMTAVAQGLATRGIATLRYQFPYMENGSKRPDRPAVAQATVRAAVEVASKLLPGSPLFAGGKSFGGRMTSQAQAAVPLDAVRGLIFFGFPLHPAGRPSASRADHLEAIAIPMLFLQGACDKLACPELLVPLIARLGKSTTLWTAYDADHSFHVPARSGKRDEQVMQDMLDTTEEWVGLLA